MFISADTHFIQSRDSRRSSSTFFAFSLKVKSRTLATSKTNSFSSVSANKNFTLIFPTSSMSNGIGFEGFFSI